MQKNEFLDNIISKIRNTYYFFEDKWYNLLDKIDPKVPVYKVVDPIDKVIPSFLLFLICLLFFIILLGYLIHFSSPFEITFTTFDSSTQATLSGVTIKGFVNEQEIDLKTNSDGKAIIEVSGSGKNIYTIFLGILFGFKEEEFQGNISAQKTGYTSHSSELISGILEKEIFLQPIADDDPLTFQGTAIVKLVDFETNNPIIDYTKASYVKFECNNKNINAKTVKDDSTGSIDGRFLLNEPNCDYRIVEAGAPNYEKNNSSITAPIGEETNIILQKRFQRENGTVRIEVIEKGTGEKVVGVRVNLTGNGFNESSFTTSNGFAIMNVPEGVYSITVNDSNYYPIKIEDNIRVESFSGELSERTIELEKILEENKRKIFIKVIDDTGPVSNATIDFYRTNDRNGVLVTFSPDGTALPSVGGNNTTDSNGLLEVKEFNNLDEGKILGIVRKEGYNTRLFVPKVITLNSGFEIILINKTTLANSANALVRVTVGEENALIPGIKTFLMQKIIDKDKTYIGQISSIDTNSTGIAFYSGLTPGEFFGRAEYRTIIADSNYDIINSGETRTLNIHIGTDVARVRIILNDARTNTLISSQEASNATVNLYSIKNNSLNFVEKMSFSQNAFVSNYYGLDRLFYVKIDLDNYRLDNIEVRNLEKGVNTFYSNLIKAFDYSPCNNCDFEAGYDCLLNEQEEFVCVKTHEGGTSYCSVDVDCGPNSNCVYDVLAKRNVCVEKPVICKNNIFAFDSQDNLVCVEECSSEKTLIKTDNYSICYNFELVACNDYKYAFKENILECDSSCNIEIGKISGTENIVRFCTREDTCTTNDNCELNQHCVMNDAGRRICNTKPIVCNNNIFEITGVNAGQKELTCVENCTNGTLIKIKNSDYSICYDFKKTCNTNIFKIENNAVNCVVEADCVSPCTIKKAGTSNGEEISFCVCDPDRTPIFDNKKYGWNGNDLININSCDGSFARLDDIFVCYPQNFSHSPNGRVSIYFNGIYSNNNKFHMLNNNLTRRTNFLHDGNSYWISFRTIIDSEEISYKELLSMTKTHQANITNIDSIGLTNNSYLGNRKLNTYSCLLENLDESLIKRIANNYYFPIDNACNVTTNTPSKRSGFEWKKNFLEKGTYYFYDQAQIIKSNDNNNFLFYFRSFEENNQSSSETNLKRFNLPIGQYFGENVFATLQISGNNAIDIDFENKIKQSNLPFNLEKDLTIKLFNGSNDVIKNAKLTLFSFEDTGAREKFETNNQEPNGYLLFDGNNSKILEENFEITIQGQKTFNTKIKSTKSYTNNQIILVLEYIDSSNNPKRLVDVIGIETKGGILLLDSGFQALIPNPTFSGEIFTTEEEGTPEIQQIQVKIDKNCNNTINSTITKTKGSPGINTTEFEIDLGEDPLSVNDCLRVSVTAVQKSDEYYEPINNKEVRPSISRSPDRTLDCVIIREKDSQNENLKRIQWNEETQLIVKNECSQKILFRINTGLECDIIGIENNCNHTPGFALDPAQERTIKIIGKNIDFDEGLFPNFSDRLGYFPVYLQTRFDQARRRFVTTREFGIIVSNDNQCFEISETIFDLRENQKKSFNITNYCQDPMPNSLIPLTKMDSFGYFLKHNESQGQINFNVELLMAGIEYGETIEQRMEYTTVQSDDIIGNAFEQYQNEENPKKYNNVVFNFDSGEITGILGQDWDTYKLQIIINDLIDTNQNNNERFYNVGLKLIDPIIITFDDGSEKNLTLNELNCNTKLNPWHCDHCNPSPNNHNHCQFLRDNHAAVEDYDSWSATFYIEDSHIGSNKKVDKIKLNFEGNENFENLLVILNPIIRYRFERRVLNRTVSQEVQVETNLGSYNIPKIPGIKFPIKNLDNIITDEVMILDNAKAAFNLDSNDVEVWIEGKMLMAKYIGNRNENKNLKIDLELSREGMPEIGTQHSIINIKDFVKQTSGKQISGVR